MISGRATATAFILLSCAGSARAQNLSGVFGPVVEDGDRSIEYRVGHRLASDGRDGEIAHRFQYAQALNDRVLWRAYAVFGEGQRGGQPEFESLTGQLYYEMRGEDRAWRSALRFSASLAEGGPEEFGIHWGNEFVLSERINARAAFFGSLETGPGASGGVLVESRFAVSYERDDDVEFGVETFHGHRTVPEFEPFSGRQQAGPYVTVPFAGDWYVLGSVLFGITPDDPDTDLRFRLGRDL